MIFGLTYLFLFCFLLEFVCVFCVWMYVYDALRVVLSNSTMTFTSFALCYFALIWFLFRFHLLVWMIPHPSQTRGSYIHIVTFHTVERTPETASMDQSYMPCSLGDTSHNTVNNTSICKCHLETEGPTTPIPLVW